MNHTHVTPATAGGHYATSMAHLAAQVAAQDTLDDIYSRPNPRRDLAAEAARKTGVALKLAEIHSNLAIVEAIDNLAARVAAAIDAIGVDDVDVPVPFLLRDREDGS